ncbi:hypothetical protein DTO027B5_267 [Paecilomyces variotii]|nr:hypothetical protein DTO027B3_2496 [Paecilomyces variotii]KAJ9338115.1 hypothetical protein DTO027B5_267 [Paecilomyces variotii]
MIVIINLARGSSVSAVQRLSRSLDNQELTRYPVSKAKKKKRLIDGLQQTDGRDYDLATGTEPNKLT